MAEQMSLGDVLSDKPAEKPEPAAPAQVETPKVASELPAGTKDPVEQQQAERNEQREAYKGIRQKHRDAEQDAQGRVRDPVTGQYVAKEKAEEPAKEAAKPEAPKVEAKPAAPQQEEMTAKEKAFLRAAHEERGKRQELERRLAAIEAQKKPEQVEAEKKTFYDDPDGALAKHMKQIEDKANQVTLQSRLQMADFVGRQKYKDYDAKIESFQELIRTVPGLYQQMLAAPDIAEFAYTTAKNHLDVRDAGGLEAMRAKIEKETEARLRVQIEADLKAKADALQAQRQALPQSLSDAPSKGVNRPVWGGPTPLDGILKG